MTNKGLPCPKCGEPTHAVYYQKKMKHRAIKRKYCEQCDLIFKINLEEE